MLNHLDAGQAEQVADQAARRLAPCSAMMVRKRRRAGGIVPPCGTQQRVSVKPISEASGVRNSWLTLAMTKSVWERWVLCSVVRSMNSQRQRGRHSAMVRFIWRTDGVARNPRRDRARDGQIGARRSPASAAA